MIRRHLTYANVTATLALVLAASTGAVYAAGEIGSRNIANNSVRTQDLKDRRGVTGEDVRRNTLGGKEIDEGSLVGGRIVQLLNDEAGTCDPQNGVFVDCASLTLDYPTPTKALLTATGGFYSEGALAELDCEIRIDNQSAATSVLPGETADATSGVATDGFARTLVTPTLGPGSHTLALSCQQIGANDGRVRSPTLAAIVVRESSGP